jgi:hypothetical protein
MQEAYEMPDDDEYYPHRMPTSARRYTTPDGLQVIQQGNRRIIIHEGLPSANKQQSHWLLFVCIGIGSALLLWVGLVLLSNWWTMHQMDATFGYPRTWQTDQVVGHADSTDHPTHFIFENLKGHVMIIELPAGNGAHAHIYSGPTIYSDNADLIPVTGEFQDTDGDGKVDMIVHIGNQRIIYVNDGTQFKLQQ